MRGRKNALTSICFVLVKHRDSRVLLQYSNYCKQYAYARKKNIVQKYRLDRNTRKKRKKKQMIPLPRVRY